MKARQIACGILTSRERAKCRESETFAVRLFNFVPALCLSNAARDFPQLPLLYVAWRLGSKPQLKCPGEFNALSTPENVRFFAGVNPQRRSSRRDWLSSHAPCWKPPPHRARSSLSSRSALLGSAAPVEA